MSLWDRIDAESKLALGVDTIPQRHGMSLLFMERGVYPLSRADGGTQCLAGTVLSRLRVVIKKGAQSAPFLRSRPFSPS